MLGDGVLSFYKVHGADKIVMSPVTEKSIKVIGEESLEYVRKANWNINGREHCKPIGEVHLKIEIMVDLESVEITGRQLGDDSGGRLRQLGCSPLVGLGLTASKRRSLLCYGWGQ
ncbi:hypothetical protein SAY87_002209 [Trapa incisa]|uniref:Uncharacterized protein n=1 Tax=Trapa incisa TaxID=236973 RepID=A0AAN7JWL3_9MYRT|nr:hypothetical protein SAY87_002209 [Trapa incisa]